MSRNDFGNYGWSTRGAFRNMQYQMPHFVAAMPAELPTLTPIGGRPLRCRWDDLSPPRGIRLAERESAHTASAHVAAKCWRTFAQICRSVSLSAVSRALTRDPSCLCSRRRFNSPFASPGPKINILSAIAILSMTVS
jgi:hypothetical protein